MIDLAAGAALKVDRRTGVSASRVFPHELQLDIGVQDLLACDAPGVSVNGAQKLVDAMEIAH
jgi:hypothetical protein